MKLLYAPWRTHYTKKATENKNSGSEKECIFCQHFSQDNDEEHYILKRFKHHAVLLNCYPYNAGHLLIIPFAHYAQLDALSQKAQHELIELISATSRIVQEQLNAPGVNIGINIGKAAGASIPAHIHWHVLPRWADDTNFLPALGHTKTISYDLDEIYRKLKPAVEKITLSSI